MSSFTLCLSSSDNGPTLVDGSAEKPAWLHVELRIDRAFQFGGRVELRAQDPKLIGTGEVRTPWWAYTEFLAMESLPGKFRLIAAPVRELGERSTLREWWEPGDSPFRGVMPFGDDEWDARTVCTDVNVAKEIFKDYFDNGELTEFSFSQMRSGWDRKPRT